MEMMIFLCSSFTSGFLVGLGLWRQTELVLGKNKRFGGALWKYAGILAILLTLYFDREHWLRWSLVFFLTCVATLGGALLVRKRDIS
jgi:hypothetical protein